ncbi:NAD-dependent epimerase/dehydratase family protein [Myxococcus sp. RHSTA-1-4]|uniref:NAD-dependent epimerase/dehydratase family protein n=1 Tax=Myxococcus sp. RHSTA-1-4 TaxID=2874601 RepID=UPI001CC0B39E|nr:NAD-dependent epimerase/dehydratase family protein [Myxococcus sp. RHSTA-1-4]MBZ4419422.1 NAD-dependent epimerase/dehydratase family protein [Myxococcus sp. RHSTA-1-4]
MKSKQILVTGGAGFIGSHLADQLIERGHRVRVLDCLLPQVHGESRARPEYLNPEVELQVGDVRDAKAVRRALEGVDAVYHFAAAVGVGQSMYEIAHYTSVNNLGTAVLLEALIQRPVKKLIVASSMSVYGEGLFRARDGNLVPGTDRPREQLQANQWDVLDVDGQPLVPIPTPETKPPALSSVYALSKYDQERLCLIFGKAYDVPTVALRFFNVYGPRQALSNPYTGVLAIFASRLMNGNAPLIFEDGLQQRDFVSVHDIAMACRLALEVPEAAGGVFNIGSGRAVTVREVAAAIAEVMGKPHIRPEIAGKYRVGDVRHCFADISLARKVLGYEPRVGFHQGLSELAEWLRGQVATDRVAEARAELEARGLTV